MTRPATASAGALRARLLWTRLLWVGPLWNRAAVLLSLASLFWAGNFVLGRALAGGVAAGDVPPLDPVALAFWRWVLAFAIVAALGGRGVWAHRAVLRRHWPRLALAGLTSVTLYNTLVYLGLQHSTALNGLLLQSAMPVMILLLGLGLYGDRIDPRQIAGVGLSCCGVVWILSGGSAARIADFSLGRGELWVLAGVACNALYFATLRSAPKLPPLVFLTASIGFGVVFLAPVWALRGADVPGTPGQWGAILYLATFASVLALLFFNRGIALIGAARAGVFLHLMPLFGTGLAVPFLNEIPGFAQLLGGAAVIGGVGLSLRSPS